MIIIDTEEILNNSSGVTLLGAFASANEDSAVFDTAANDRTYFSRPIPDEWQGETIEWRALLHHRTGSLTGTGSPPDDQVKLECGFALLADTIVYVDLGTTNDGTAPNEIDQTVQLGTIQEAVIWHLISSILIGPSDRFFHGRFNRDGVDADDGLAGNLHVISMALLLPPI